MAEAAAETEEAAKAKTPDSTTAELQAAAAKLDPPPQAAVETGQSNGSFAKAESAQIEPPALVSAKSPVNSPSGGKLRLRPLKASGDTSGDASGAASEAKAAIEM